MSWLHLHEVIHVFANKFPKKLAFKDKKRAVTYKEFDERTTKLAHALRGLGLIKGDKLAVLLNNSIEFAEIYIACAKANIVIVPINFRLTAKDGLYICKNSEAKALIFEERYLNSLKEIWQEIDNLFGKNKIILEKSGNQHLINYEDLITSSPSLKYNFDVEDEDPWVLLYTSGTTGIPKGVVRSHRSYSSFFLINAVEFSFTSLDYALIIMPLSHVNSTFYAFVFTYIGASVFLGKEYEFNPEEFLRIIDKEKITFTSLVPTHYTLILNLSDDIKEKYDRSSLTTILTSSAPVRKSLKLRIMDFFNQARLFEAYGSTEGGLVTILRPENQIDKLGSIGQECIGSDSILILDPQTKEPVENGKVGELYSRSPMLFSKYYKNNEKTQSAMVKGFFSARDLAKKDAEGFFYLVDRKDNMIITGGEKVYPSEVEETISKISGVMDVAVIGIPDEIWGEAVKAVVVKNSNSDIKSEEIIKICGNKVASFKKPKSVDFISNDEMPRTATGKILHRKLREKYVK
ncbi:MAG: Long-chain-fatty-acid--CoA ligase [Candidatus Heimdallarchaeota archaeon LC_3]|nr:MAG: Long-chain-fatty-acid--CoA ligase [Candidatus Heimdallarchaeota archaeon LC_3]